MKTREPEPLWREVVGDTEPWRRGRLALITFGAFMFINHALVLAGKVLTGNVERLLIMAIFMVIWWLQFYFIWIGLHWVRWVGCAFSALFGFALLIWGLRDEVPAEMLSGAFGFASVAYIGFAPSVYFLRSDNASRCAGWNRLRLPLSAC
ncbi:MAG: hypothetical protein ABI871_02810 [Chthoniobacterales bacterium]